MEVDDQPGVLAQVAEVLGMQGASIKSVVQRGLGEHARLVMVAAPAARVALLRGGAADRADAVRALRAARDPGDGRGVRLMGLIERYRERLPFARGRPGRVARGGLDAAACCAERLSERVGAEVWLKIEGANPTGSFKDRGMTCAVSDAVRGGAEAVICASTGNTAASLAAYAARAGLRGAVIVPEGKIATGKLAQALMHGARVIALRGQLRRGAEARARAHAAPPDRARQLGQPVPAGGAEDRGVRGRRGARRELDALCIPVGNAGNITAYWKGFREIGAAPRMLGFQAEGAAPLVHGAPVAQPETIASAIRIGNPARWEEAMEAFTGSRGARRRGQRRPDPRRLPLPRRARGRVLRAGVGGERGGAADARRRRRAEASSACSPATG